MTAYIRYLTFSLLFFSFVNCSKDETSAPKPVVDEQIDSEPDEPKEPETEVYFTLNILGPRDLGATEEWIIVHNKNGNLLDYRQYDVGDTIKFEAPVDSLTDKIAVTEFKYIHNADDNSKFHYLSTTTEIPKGSEWNFGSKQDTLPQPLVEIGRFEIKINNIPSPRKIIISDQNGRLYESFSGHFDTNSFYDFSESVPMFENADHFFISVLDGNNDLKLSDFSNPNGLDLTLDYSKFIAAASTIEINLPPHSAYYLNVAAFEPGTNFGNFNGYWLHDIISSFDEDISTSPLKFGYLNHPTIEYRTNFSIKMDGYDYGLTKYGDKLQELSIPEKPDLMVQNESLFNFEFSVAIDYKRAGHKWKSVQGKFETNDYSQTTWSIAHDFGIHSVIGNLPEGILEKYQDLNVENLQYTSSHLNIKTEIGPNPGNWEHEQITVYN